MRLQSIDLGHFSPILFCAFQKERDSIRIKLRAVGNSRVFEDFQNAIALTRVLRDYSSEQHSSSSETSDLSSREENRS
jgi:hypothetical protein